MAKKQFKAQSKRLLDLMIHSIYTHKEIFLRELISNASDAMDKLYYQSLKGDISGLNREDFDIHIVPSKDNRTLTIRDNGIGMTKEEMEKNLGTIAESGSFTFKDGEPMEDIDIIGQFGVGFYSAFMVSKEVTVTSRAYGSEEAFVWTSKGSDGYTLKGTEKEGYGTEIVLTLKDNEEDENYDKFLEEYELRNLVTKYSDYIRYPITMMVEKTKPAEEEDQEPEHYQEKETLNTMVPLWKRQKKELKEEDYHRFYQEKFFDFAPPAKVIHTEVEGMVSYTSLLFIPGQAPFDYYTKDFKKGLQLYSSGVLIMDKCEDLLPDYFSFVKGLVDSPDFSLNISREILQQDRQLRGIAKNLERKIKGELLNLQKNDREAYEDFFKNFGLQLKYGLYEKMGLNKDVLQDLVLFYSSMEKKMITLEEYTKKMKEDQKHIYYASGSTVEKIDQLPQTEGAKAKGFEILYLTDDIDEFALQALQSYQDKPFKSISGEDFGQDQSDEEKKAAEKKQEESKDLLSFLKESLGEKVTEVKLSQRLKSHPVCLTTKGPVSLEMEKVLSQMPSDQEVKADRILEINGDHGVMKALEKAYEEDREKAKMYGLLLYNQALLIEGMPVDDPVDFGDAICQLMMDV